MITHPTPQQSAEEELEQAQRLIVENRNEDGSYDMQGIAKDIAELLYNIPQSLPNEEKLRALIRNEIVNPSVHSEVSTADIAVGMLSSTAVNDRVRGIVRLIQAYTARKVVETGINELKTIRLGDSVTDQIKALKNRIAELENQLKEPK